MTWRLISKSLVGGRIEARLHGVGKITAGRSAAPSTARLIVFGDMARVFFVNDEEPAFAASEAAMLASFLLRAEAGLCEDSDEDFYCGIELSWIDEGCVAVRDPGSIWLVFDYFNVLPLWDQAQNEGKS